MAWSSNSKNSHQLQWYTQTVLWSYPSGHWENNKAFLWMMFMIFGSNCFFYTQKHLNSFTFLDWIIIISYSIHFIIVRIFKDFSRTTKGVCAEAILYLRLLLWLHYYDDVVTYTWSIRMRNYNKLKQQWNLFYPYPLGPWVVHNSELYITQNIL